MTYSILEQVGHQRLLTGDFKTLEEAEARLAEMIEEDPAARDVLRIVSIGEPPNPGA